MDDHVRNPNGNFSQIIKCQKEKMQPTHSKVMYLLPLIRYRSLQSNPHWCHSWQRKRSLEIPTSTKSFEMMHLLLIKHFLLKSSWMTHLKSFAFCARGKVDQSNSKTVWQKFESLNVEIFSISQCFSREL